MYTTVFRYFHDYIYNTFLLRRNNYVSYQTTRIETWSALHLWLLFPFQMNILHFCDRNAYLRLKIKHQSYWVRHTIIRITWDYKIYVVFASFAKNSLSFVKASKERQGQIANRKIFFWPKWLSITTNQKRNTLNGNTLFLHF